MDHPQLGGNSESIDEQSLPLQLNGHLLTLGSNCELLYPSQYTPPQAGIDGPYLTFEAPAPIFMAGAALEHMHHQYYEDQPPPGYAHPDSTDSAVEQLAALDQPVKLALQHAQALPPAIRHHFLEPLQYVLRAVEHYSVAESSTPLPILPGQQVRPLSPRPKWHEWSRRIATHLRHTLRPGYHWHPLSDIARDVHLPLHAAMHAVDHNPKFRLRPNSAGDQIEVRATHSDLSLIHI